MSEVETIGSEDALRTSLVLLGAAFNRAVEKAVATAFWMALRDLTPGEISLATSRALATCRYFPAPSELRALAGKGRDGDIALAWEAVRRAVDVHDYTTSVDFGAFVNAIVRNIGGWQRLCALPIEQLNVWARKEFERVYLAFVDKDPATLNGAPHRGELGGRPVRIAIGGKLPPRALPAATAPGARELGGLVRKLAEAKSR